MFDTILNLPLFQGLTQEDVTNIVGHVKFNFVRVEEGETLFSAGSTCDYLCFLLRGQIEKVTAHPKKEFIIYEKYQAPYLFEPDRFFGLHNSYQSDYIALSQCNVLKVKKIYVLNELFNYDVFRMNFAGIVCSRAQAFAEKVWRQMPAELEERVCCFLLNYFDTPRGEKKVNIKMTDLAAFLGTSRLNISKALKSLAERELLQIRRSEIIVPDASLLQGCISGKQ